MLNLEVKQYHVHICTERKNIYIYVCSFPQIQVGIEDLGTKREMKPYYLQEEVHINIHRSFIYFVKVYK